MTESTASSPTTARPRAWLTDSPRRMDLLSAGTLLVLAAVTSTAPGVDLSATELTVAVAGSVIQSAALLFRRRAPLVVLAVSVAVLVVTAVVTGDPVASELGVAFAALRRRDATPTCRDLGNVGGRPRGGIRDLPGEAAATRRR